MPSCRDALRFTRFGEYRYNQLPPAVLSAFERHWLPYLDGKTSLEQALHDLVRDAR